VIHLVDDPGDGKPKIVDKSIMTRST